MSERGFRYDRLTEAADETVEAVRDRIYTNPCGEGPWVSIRTGFVLDGRGGNEREQEHWAAEGPWVRITKHPGRDEEQRRSREYYAEVERMKTAIADLIGAER